MIKKIMLSTFAVLLCACANDNRSDLAAEHNGYVSNINLLQMDKTAGVSRKIEKVTRETVDTEQDLHNKVVTIQEELSKGHVKGKAEAEMIFDSKTRQRSGKRLVTVEDDGSGELSEFVDKFETVQYKKISNDIFVDKAEKQHNIDAVQQENTPKIVAKESAVIEQDSISPPSLEGQSVYKMQPISEATEEDKVLNNSLLEQEKSQTSDATSAIKVDVLGEANSNEIRPIILHDFSKNS